MSAHHHPHQTATEGETSTSLAFSTPTSTLKWQRFSMTTTSQPLLRGKPHTGGMRSGGVRLGPGEVMHKHSTGGSEEQLLFLAGRARVVLAGEPVELAAGDVLYIPPHTEHEVHNHGTEDLRYVYTVAPVL